METACQKFILAADEISDLKEVVNENGFTFFTTVIVDTRQE